MRTHSWSRLRLAFLMPAALALVLLVSWPTRAGGPWYVAPGGDDGNDCLGPLTPCATINSALAKASPGDTILVASGTYSGSGEQVVTVSKDAVLSGGWDPAFGTQEGYSTIDGQYARRGMVVNSGVSADVLRFVVQNGFSDWGCGGILNGPSYGGVEGTLALCNSAVVGNQGPLVGGGICNWYGRLILDNSSVVDNVVLQAGGAGGGGIYSFHGELVLNNTTISGNSSNSPGGGIAADVQTVLKISSSTVSDNTSWIAGGLFVPTSAVLQNTVVAGNQVTIPNPPDCTGFTSAGYNLIGDATGCPFVPGPGDLAGVDARLFPVVGLPGYHPLLLGSPAIDAGDPAGCKDHLGAPLDADQRGVPRLGRCDIGAFEFSPEHDPLSHAHLPMLQYWLPGIHGRVTFGGAPAAGVALELRFFDGNSWSTRASVNTGADGRFAFLDMPGLGPGHQYYVRYLNDEGTPGRLWMWGTRVLTSYVWGSPVAVGDFDIADIALVLPADGDLVMLPYTFQWTPRPATPTDSYEFDLYDPVDGDPSYYTDPPLGYVGSYTVYSLPFGFSPWNWYVWEVWVYGPDGGYGISYETRWVIFQNAGQEGTAGAQPVSPKAVPEPARPGWK